MKVLWTSAMIQFSYLTQKMTKNRYCQHLIQGVESGRDLQFQTLMYLVTFYMMRSIDALIVIFYMVNIH